MKLARAVDAQANEKLIFFKELAPGVIQLGAIRLQGVIDDPATGEFFLEFDDVLEVVEAEQGGFASLPGECDFLSFL
jgi:hypothetical protein